MLTVKNVAQFAGVTPDTVRHYVRIKLINPSIDPINRYKIFTMKDLQRVRFIRQTKQLGFSLNEIKELLASADKSESPCPRAREIIQNRFDGIQKSIDELVQLKSRMESALMAWSKMPNKSPSGKIICHLIEES